MDSRSKPDDMLFSSFSIEKIKEKRDEEIYGALSNAPDPECPPGHTKVDNRQRVATLEQLTISK